jgi:hypothetical protein
MNIIYLKTDVKMTEVYNTREMHATQIFGRRYCHAPLGVCVSEVSNSGVSLFGSA